MSLISAYLFQKDITHCSITCAKVIPSTTGFHMQQITEEQARTMLLSRLGTDFGGNKSEMARAVGVSRVNVNRQLNGAGLGPRMLAYIGCRKERVNGNIVIYVSQED